MSRSFELLAAIVMSALLAFVLASWPGNDGLGSWCGVVNRCATPLPAGYSDKWRMQLGESVEVLRAENERLRLDNAVLSKNWQGK